MNNQSKNDNNIFKIKADGIDVKEVMKKIREKISKENLNILSDQDLDELTKNNFIFPPMQHEINDELSDIFQSPEKKWNLMHQNIFEGFYDDPEDWNLDPKYKPTSHRKLSGFLIVAFKKTVRPLVRLYTDLIIFRQAKINHNFYKGFENLLRDQGRINQYLALLNHNLIKELTRTKLHSDSLEYNIKQLKSEIDFLKKREKALERLINKLDQSSI